MTFGSSSSLERISVEALGPVQDRGVHGTKVTPCCLVEISIPDSVRELCNGCFR